MKKSLTLLLLLITYQSISQIKMEGIVVKNIFGQDVGDTVIVVGIKNFDYSDNQYLIENTNGTRLVNESKIKLLDEQYDYWEKTWFKYRALEVSKNGWDYSERQILNEEANEYYRNALKSDIVFENELLYDYIYQTLLEIHPLPLKKMEDGFFKVLIIKSTDAESFSFDNGMIVFTTALLANLESKNDLLEVLTENISHIVLDHNLINLKQEIKAERRAAVFSGIATVVAAAGSAYAAIEHDVYIDPYLPADIGLATYFISKSLMESAGASYNMDQISRALSIKREYISKMEEVTTEEESAFEAYMAPAVSFTAWQGYYLKNYAQSLQLNQKLNEKQLAIEDDYLLFSKLIRSTSNTKEANIDALNYLAKAQKMSNNQLIDLDKEAALLYLRLGDKENAAIALKNYKAGLHALKDTGIDISKELNNINQIIFYHRLETENDSIQNLN